MTKASSAQVEVAEDDVAASTKKSAELQEVVPTAAANRWSSGREHEVFRLSRSRGGDAPGSSGVSPPSSSFLCVRSPSGPNLEGPACRSAFLHR